MISAGEGMGAARLREALEEIKRDCGRVCPEFELCEHIVCQSSYAAWAIADEALAAVPEAPDAVYEWRAVFPNSDGSYSVQPLAKAPRPGTRMLVEGHNRGWVERRHAVAWERVEEGTEEG